MLAGRGERCKRRMSGQSLVIPSLPFCEQANWDFPMEPEKIPSHKMQVLNGVRTQLAATGGALWCLHREAQEGLNELFYEYYSTEEQRKSCKILSDWRRQAYAVFHQIPTAAEAKIGAGENMRQIILPCSLAHAYIPGINRSHRIKNDSSKSGSTSQ